MNAQASNVTMLWMHQVRMWGCLAKDNVS